jgi:hypothetical protein
MNIYDLRGIMSTEADVTVYPEFFEDGDPLRDRCVEDRIVAAMSIRWQRTEDEQFTQHGPVSYGFYWRLLDWSVTRVTVNDKEVRTEEDFPGLQRIVNALFCRRVRRALEEKGPEARVIE